MSDKMDAILYRPPVVIDVRASARDRRRPLYEKKENIDREKRFIERISATTHFTFQKLKKLYLCDFSMLEGKRVVGFIEFKHRPGALDYPDGVMLSLDKLTKLISLRQYFGARAIFAIENADLEYYAAELWPDPLARIVIGGRTDRKDTADIEPVALIPKSRFKPISTFLQEIYDAKSH